MIEKCEHRTIVLKGKWWHRCEKPAVKDGYCAQHHPDEISRKRAERLAQTEEIRREMANGN